jgi:hypothetical protein
LQEHRHHHPDGDDQPPAGGQRMGGSLSHLRAYFLS